jgi:phenylalanyl-tRNA synthetase beta chain
MGENMVANAFFCVDPAYFPGRAASIYYRSPPTVQVTLNDVKEAAVSRDTVIGTLGVLHPSVLANFEINYPCSALEFNVEVFLKK